MSAMNDTYQPIDLRPFFTLALLAVIGALIGAVLLSTHAVKRHGTEAEVIRQCMSDSGPIQQWQNKDEPNVHCFVVETPCGKWGVMIAQRWPSLMQRCDYRERTSFIPRDGEPNNVMEYLSKTFERIK